MRLRDEAAPPRRAGRRAGIARGLAIAAAIVCALCLHVPTHAGDQSTPSVSALLDRYLAGDFDSAVAAVATLGDLDPVIDFLSARGEAWINIGDPVDRPRRELAAATFALEAARPHVWRSWKIRREQPPMVMPDGAVYRPPAVLTWAPAARLVEWGCARFRRDATPRPMERWWQLGAIAVAERAEDPEFLTGSVLPVGNAQTQIVHLDHILGRFPHEPRFRLVQALTLDWLTWPQIPRGAAPNPTRLGAALAAYESLLGDTELEAEATIRLAGLLVRSGSTDRAITLLTAADEMTRDRYLVYLGRYFKGKAYEAQRKPAEAIDAYRGAVATIPGGQAASIALAALLVNADRRDEAQPLGDTTLSVAPIDPWRAYADADDRFWPEILARLRAGIHR